MAPRTRFRCLQTYPCLATLRKTKQRLVYLTEPSTNDLIAEINPNNEPIRAAKDEHTQAEKRLVAAGESIRLLTLKRSSERKITEETSLPSSTGSVKKVIAKAGNWYRGRRNYLQLLH